MSVWGSELIFGFGLTWDMEYGILWEDYWRHDIYDLLMGNWMDLGWF